jgi:hypothetical protein
MSTFASSFWSTDYAAGLGVLFGKLQQGVQENSQFMAVARMRAEAEDAYGSKLGEIEGATNRISGGFQKDDGASVKKVCLRARLWFEMQANWSRPTRVCEQRCPRLHATTARSHPTSASL